MYVFVEFSQLHITKKLIEFLYCVQYFDNDAVSWLKSYI
jgi:hypothetical protein